MSKRDCLVKNIKEQETRLWIYKQVKLAKIVSQLLDKKGKEGMNYFQCVFSTSGYKNSDSMISKYKKISYLLFLFQKIHLNCVPFLPFIIFLR